VKNADRPVRYSRKVRAISTEVLEAGRAEAMAARREPGMPPDLVDRTIRRLDLRPAPFI
jgi:CPA1 family monovalent cation:H+ antiporter